MGESISLKKEKLIKRNENIFFLSFPLNFLRIQMNLILSLFGGCVFIKEKGYEKSNICFIIRCDKRNDLCPESGNFGKNGNDCAGF